MNEGMSVGSVVGMTSCEVHQGTKKEWLRTRYTAQRGNRMMFLFLGTEKIDGPELDPIEQLYRLGWSNPDFPRNSVSVEEKA